MAILELRVPPPAVALAIALLAWAGARAWPSLRFAELLHRSNVAAIVAVLGVLVIAAGMLHFRRAGTTVNPLNPGATSALVRGGVYRFTRNPMYLGLAVVLLAWTIHLSHWIALVGIVVFVAYITRFQIIPEERALRALFPGSFEEYSRSVRRWL